ncbi:MAG: hypothetical protein VKI83_02460 [Synechococcaceae cyanobacterium]|nr:hypothetical protein [Synechococcaceae cyanobacterium]
MNSRQTSPPSPIPRPSLAAIERQAAARGLLLRLQVRRRLVVTTLRVVVARQRPEQAPLLLGELKGWALPLADGLQLDTMRVQGERCEGVGPLIWCAVFAWALEASPCRRARLLAIRDNDAQHRRLVRYFQRLGFEPTRPVAAGAADLPLRLIWGGAGLLMRGDCDTGLERAWRQLRPRQEAAP